MEPGPIPLERYRKVVVLTGAGISVASGLRAYRGPNGLWEDEKLRALNRAAALREDPAGVWALFGGLRSAARAAMPNAAHAALAAAEARVAGELFVLTQNVDGLHARAGSRRVVELHGSAFRTRCIDPACALAPFADDAPHADGPPACPACGGPLRPDVVLFDEPLPVDAEWAAKQALRDCDLFVAIGSSGTVSPASNFVRSARYEGARTVFVNLEPMAPPNPAFEEQHLGPAEVIVPRLFGA
jgi:NAD-dependent deacetylase